MKKFSLFASLVLAFALTAWGQTPSSNDTQNNSGSSAQSGQSSSSGNMGSMGQSGSMGSSSTQGTADQTSGSKSAEAGTREHKLKGCLESENGAYVIREKSGKEVAVTGSADMSQYVNHEVVAHGTWSSGAGAASSSTSDMSKGSASEKQFTATKINSVSDTCKGGKHAKSKGSSSTSNPSSPQ